MIDADAGHDVVADLPHGGVVVAEKPRGDLLFARRAAFGRGPHQRHVAADVLAQQLLGLEQVVLVVLLEDADARRLAERSKMHRRRVHGGGDVHEMQIGRAARERQVANVANEGDVGVVNGDSQLRLIIERRCHGLRGGSGCGCGGAGVAQDDGGCDKGEDESGDRQS